MIHVIGSAVKMIAEVDILSGTTVTLKNLKGPDGTDILTNQAMSFDDASNTLNATVAWQSLLGTHDIGRYTYLVKSVNGIYTNVAKGLFFLEEE